LAAVPILKLLPALFIRLIDKSAKGILARLLRPG